MIDLDLSRDMNGNPFPDAPDATKFHVAPEEVANIRAELERRHADLERALGLGWIPVGERLPKGLVYVLVMCTNEAAPLGVACYSYALAEWVNVWATVGIAVTHWRPLPAPPKEDGRA